MPFVWLLFHLQQMSFVVLYLNFQSILDPGVYFDYLLFQYYFPSTSLNVMDVEL